MLVVLSARKQREIIYSTEAGDEMQRSGFPALILSPNADTVVAGIDVRRTCS